MYALIEIGGSQIKVAENQKIFVNRLEESEGSEITLDKVLLTSTDNNINVGSPYVPNVSVTAKILKHLKGDKVLVFKKKKRKGFRKLNGHRQYLTQLEIVKINQ